MAKVKKAPTKKGSSGAILSNNIKSHANDPFFVKKLKRLR